MKPLQLILAVMLALTTCMLAGCMNKDDDRTQDTCTPEEALRNGEYAIVNGQYNYTSYPHRYTQCIVLDRRENTYKWFWAEKPPVSEETYERTSAYIIYGCNISVQPTDGLDFRECLSPKLPVDIEESTSLVVYYDFSVSSTSQYTLTISAEALYSYYGGSTDVSIDVVVDSAGWSFDGEPQARVTIDEAEYDYYEYDWHEYDRHLRGFPSASYSRYFVKVIPSQKGELHFDRFLDFLEGRKGSAYLRKIDSIYLSQNIRGGGSGSTTVYNYSVELKQQSVR